METIEQTISSPGTASFGSLSSPTWGFLFTMPTETMEKHRLVATLNSPRRKGLTRSCATRQKNNSCIVIAGRVIICEEKKKWDAWWCWCYKHWLRICSRRPRKEGCSTVETCDWRSKETRREPRRRYMNDTRGMYRHTYQFQRLHICIMDQQLILNAPRLRLIATDVTVRLWHCASRCTCASDVNIQCRSKRFICKHRERADWVPKSWRVQPVKCIKESLTLRMLAETGDIITIIWGNSLLVTRTS